MAPQVVNGCEEIAMMSGLERRHLPTWVENSVSARSHFSQPSTSKPAALAAASMVSELELEWAKSLSTPPATVLASGYFSLSHLKRWLYIVGSWGTFRKDHSEIFARPGLIAVSVKIGNWSPESPASPAL